jgi:tetratricopeptide (TPR) repeat protein
LRPGRVGTSDAGYRESPLHARHPFAVVAFALAVAVSIPQAAVAAQDGDKQDYCSNKAGLYLADFSVEACTYLIMSGSRTPKDLAVVFSYRCKDYLEDEKFERALQDCDQAIWLDANFLPAYQIRGLVHEQANHHRRAVADFAQVIAQQPANAGAWDGLCRNELALDHHRLAISACSESLQLRPGHAATLVTRGLAYLRSGALDAAIADFDNALQANPALPAALYGRGMARLERHDRDNGEADIAAATAIQGDIARQFADRRRLITSRSARFDDMSW